MSVGQINTDITRVKIAKYVIQVVNRGNNATNIDCNNNFLLARKRYFLFGRIFIYVAKLYVNRQLGHNKTDEVSTRIGKDINWPRNLVENILTRRILHHQ